MSFFNRPDKWTVDALVTISVQLNMIEKKLNILLQLVEDQGKLSKLARELNASSESLQAAIEQAKTKGK